MGFIKKSVLGLALGVAVFGTSTMAQATVDVKSLYVREVNFGSGFSFAYSYVSADEQIADISLVMPDGQAFGPAQSFVNGGYIVYVFRIPGMHITAENQSVDVHVTGQSGSIDTISATCAAAYAGFICK